MPGGSPRLRLADLARARGLAPELLTKLGWQERPTGVAIPWPLAGGGVAWHVRHRLERQEREGPSHDADPGPRWTWQGFDRDRLLPYGHERLARMRERAPEVLVVVESEVDAVGLWVAGVSALATGGADGWQDRWWALAAPFGRVVLWLEDAGSITLLRRLVQTQPDDAPPLYVCHALAGPAKDPGRILAALNGTGREVLRRIVAGGVPVTRVARTTAELLDMVAERLGARRGGAGYEASCPFHPDRHPSLSIFRGDDGGWGFRCHGGRCGARGPLALLAACLGIALGPPSTSLPTLRRPVGSEVVPPLPTLLEATAAELAEEGGADAAMPPSLPLLGQSGYFIQGWAHLLAGYPRAGKTELLTACALDWCRAGESVVYLTEESRSIWSVRLARAKADLPESDHKALTRLRLVFALGANPETLLARAVGGDEGVVVVDTLRNLLQLQDETDNSHVAQVLNPWIAAARTAGKTLIVAHHMRKGGGEHGEGIAGGHALLGTFDVALELLRDGQHPHRRLLRAYARLIAPPELVYERGEDGTFRVLGDPDAVRRDEVRSRVQAALTGEWQSTTEVHEALDEPRPSKELVRLVLTELAHAGVVERDPDIAVARAQGRTVRWRLREPPEPPEPREPPEPPEPPPPPLDQAPGGTGVGAPPEPEPEPERRGTTSLPTDLLKVGSEVVGAEPAPTQQPARLAARRTRGMMGTVGCGPTRPRPRLRGTAPRPRTGCPAMMAMARTTACPGLPRPAGGLPPAPGQGTPGPGSRPGRMNRRNRRGPGVRADVPGPHPPTPLSL